MLDSFEGGAFRRSEPAGSGAAENGFASPAGETVPAPLVDRFGRQVTYLRVSVTDRCNFRCGYCMSESTTFVPKPDVLSLEELERICAAFVRLGVRKLRITGGEPLVRRGILTLFRGLSRHLFSGAADELTLTTNGSRLARHAAELAACGVRRVNISLDTRDPIRFRAISPFGELGPVLDGIAAAKAAGLAVKINTVALKGVNEEELPGLVGWCGAHGLDMTLIEVMPVGAGRDRPERYLPLTEVRTRLAERWTLIDTPERTGGPARYVRVAETGRRLGFITPLTHSFCEGCNRVRLTCTGVLYLCLGQNDKTDLRDCLRSGMSDADLDEAIRSAITRKPKGHGFAGPDASCSEKEGRITTRSMNATGG